MFFSLEPVACTARVITAHHFEEICCAWRVFVFRSYTLGGEQNKKNDWWLGMGSHKSPSCLRWPRLFLRLTHLSPKTFEQPNPSTSPFTNKRFAVYRRYVASRLSFSDLSIDLNHRITDHLFVLFIYSSGRPSTMLRISPPQQSSIGTCSSEACH